MDALFQGDGLSDRVSSDVWESVSALEGGFDAVQTYDTGYVLDRLYPVHHRCIDGKHSTCHDVLASGED